MTVLAFARPPRGDDGRCATCGELRYVCRLRGGHGERCEHPPDRVAARPFLMHGFLPWLVAECADCGECLWMDRDP